MKHTRTLKSGAVARRGKFGMGDTPDFDGWTTGETWNGFACPFFTREQGLKVIEFFNSVDWYGRWEYDRKAKEFRGVLTDGDREVITEDRDGFYTIGVGWVWCEVQRKDQAL
jgi:hypothetical protein